MRLSRTTKYLLLAALVLGLAVIYFPLLVVLLNSFNADTTFGWPPSSFTLEWWGRAATTAIALVLGTMAAFALQKYRFFGRNQVSLLIILPIALPGVITGIALNNAFRTILGVDLGLFTAIVAHATFCIVVVFNNVVARPRRMGGNLEEASMDLGADGLTTFRLVTFPMRSSALRAGGLLAFALSFDEIIVTTFTLGTGLETLPIWILNNLFRPNQAPIVNVVAAVLILASTVPLYPAQRLSGDTTSGGRL
ncbi:spermidine/putrescine ABC transporter permease [Amycolatopsis coloradensis]|uniref:Spermidine/putrescine ABC transporter permease n=1 Tax=Amycolatopsis coloradensis TaxID=76021 RepID=A0A1R0KQI6_9PSEU|nr:ABC transporter permease [Amycolatopsis coloradensis]OLZ49391.1 spermidine/putrescine ABC transporter permease [Amycolatopsis coloradensis]